MNTFPGQFPVTAPDLAVDATPGGMIVDIDDLASETTSETENLYQDLGNRLVELPGSNLDFGDGNSRGIGIMTYLNAPIARLQGLSGRIDAEFVQDPRVVDSYTQFLPQPDGSYVIASQVTTVVGVFGFSWGWSQQGLFPQGTTKQ